ncbi:hypothetical protein C8R45DRAFT_1110757 [Mycena sanguinolenta]|nr:hypothetical protein C8R45DRAFT_1110757 [Mycena sanguinolenta]
MAPLNAEQLQQAANLRDILMQQITPPQNSTTTSSDSLGDGDLGGAPTRGTVRPRDELGDDEEFSLQTLDSDNPNLPYTLEQGRAFKRQKNLTGASDIDADIFLNTSNPMRHLFQLTVVALQCRDILHGIKADQERRYKLPDTLSKVCQDYAHVALLSPKARCYRNSKGNAKIAKSIVSAMRLLGVSDMPPSHETGRCDVLIKVLGKALTDKRYHIKNAITESLSGKKVDIATLTRTCIGTSPAQPTAALYQRIAFLRSVVVSYSEANPKRKKKASTPRAPSALAAEAPASDAPEQADSEKENTKDKDDGFWKAVDDDLAVYYSDSFTAGERQILWDCKYQDDLKLYGPVDNTIPITLMTNLENWLTTLNTAMETCQ